MWLIGTQIKWLKLRQTLVLLNLSEVKGQQKLHHHLIQMMNLSGSWIQDCDYVGGDFKERKELNDIIENRPANESPTPALAAPTTPPYEPISSADEAETAATTLLQVMESMGPSTSPVPTEPLSCVAISRSTTSATSSTVYTLTSSSSTAPVMSILPPQLQVASSMSVQVTTSAPTSLSTTYSPTNPLSLDLPVETPYIPKTLNEMRIEDICRDVARDTIELYEKKILKNGDPAQRDERCPHGYLRGQQQRMAL